MTRLLNAIRRRPLLPARTPAEIMRRAEVRWRLLIVFALAPAVAGAFLWLLRYLLTESWYTYPWPISYLLFPGRHAGIVLLLLFASALLLLYLYLQTGLSHERYLNEALAIANEASASAAAVSCPSSSSVSPESPPPAAGSTT